MAEEAEHRLLVAHSNYEKSSLQKETYHIQQRCDQVGSRTDRQSCIVLPVHQGFSTENQYHKDGKQNRQSNLLPQERQLFLISSSIYD